MSLNQKFSKFNKVDFNKFLNFKVIDNHIGYTHVNFAKYLCKYFSKNFVINGNNIILKNIDNATDYISLTKFFDNLAIFLFNKKVIKQITNEYFDVISLDNFTNLFKIERNLLNLFGIVAKGVHLNGYVKKIIKFISGLQKEVKINYYILVS